MEIVVGKRVVELGAGGSGILAALGTRLGCKKWVATDWGDAQVLERLKMNVEMNRLGGCVGVVEYKWGSEGTDVVAAAATGLDGGIVDLMVAADVIYPSMTREQITDLVTSFLVFSRDQRMHVREFYCAYVNRDGSGKTLKRLLVEVVAVLDGLCVSVIPFEEDWSGCMLKFYLDDRITVEEKMAMITDVGNLVMPGVWSKTEEVVEEWVAPYESSDEDEE
ncbi:hypothetical protein HDU79_006768 [Rhizoclosmatium sp. JEL0117]|nr:hypothetical protein HDU79_006768 [Rhizoclosmatium sp. JEL0117]